jgi:hypothetical protein
VFSVREGRPRLNPFDGHGIVPGTMSGRALVKSLFVSGMIAIFASCSERTGEPVVWVGPPLDDTTGSGGAWAGEGNAPVPSGAGGRDPWGGLCAPCVSGRECGGRNDYCVALNEHERFCGRDCFQGGGCPTGYLCERVRSEGEPQCVPVTGNCRHIPLKATPTPSELREAALDVVNDVRARYGLRRLGLDLCLNVVAQESAEELAGTRDLRGKFERECAGNDHCECDWAGEAEGMVAAFDLRWEDVVERSIEEHLSESPNGRYVRTLLSPDFKRLGVGVVLSGDEGFSALAFGL